MNKDSLLTTLSRFAIEAKRLLDETHQAEDRNIYESFFAQAGVIQAKIERDQDFRDSINTMDRLFGNSWLKDESAYRHVYSTWDLFKSLLIESIQGMTVNERLSMLGFFDEYDKAVKRGNEDRLRVILSKCLLNEDNIRKIIDHEFRHKH
ncbi:MAG: hypothetical protein WCD79_02900 [Chthoniobacteraceae bacterium]